MNSLHRNPILGFLLDPFGKCARSMEVDGDNIRIALGRQVQCIPLGELTGPPALQKGFSETALTITSDEPRVVKLKAAERRNAVGFSEAVKASWTRFHLSALERDAERLDRILANVLSLVVPLQYPSACQIMPLLRDARDLDKSLLRASRSRAVRGLAL